MTGMGNPEKSGSGATEMDHAEKPGFKKGDRLLIIVVFAAALACVVLFAFGRWNSGKDSFYVVIRVNDAEILRVPLGVDAIYAVVDGKAERLKAEDFAENTGEKAGVVNGETVALKAVAAANPDAEDINIIVISDRSVRCSESNCDNQVCVHTGAINADAQGLPIVCLPHRLIVAVEGEE